MLDAPAVGSEIGNSGRCLYASLCTRGQGHTADTKAETNHHRGTGPAPPEDELIR